MPTKRESSSTLELIVVGLGLACVPATALLGHQRLAVMELGVLVLAFVIARVLRPGETWTAARSRWFDILFGTCLAVALFAFASYANSPMIR